MSGIRVRLCISAPLVIDVELPEGSPESTQATAALAANLQSIAAHLAGAQSSVRLPAPDQSTAPLSPSTQRESPPLPPLATLTGPLLRQRRLAADLTVDALANLTRIAPKTIRNIEAGRHYPTERTQRRLCAVAVLNLCPAEPLPKARKEHP